MTARIISLGELNEESRRRTVRCSCCKQWIRYVSEDVTTDKPNDRCFILCPGCGYERVLAIGGIRDQT